MWVMRTEVVKHKRGFFFPLVDLIEKQINPHFKYLKGVRLELGSGLMHVGRNSFSRCCSVPPEKAMALHSNTLAWKIPWIEEPGRLQSMGSRRLGHDWVTSLSLFTFMHWRRKWQPIPVFSPGESQGQGSLVGCYLWGRTEPDRTEST